MSNPWPLDNSKDVLFILDASHRVERGLLDDWLSSSSPEPANTGKVDKVVLRIGRAPEKIATQNLEQALNVAADTIIVPLRVAWFTSVDNKNATPRLRDLLSGNPRRPKSGKASRILNKDPSRAKCIVANSASLGELQERLASRLGRPADPVELAGFIAGQAGLALDIAERRLQGGRYKVPRQVANNLQASAKFRNALEKVSEETGRTVEDLQAESVGIMKELISIPRTFWLDVMDALNRVIISLGYDPEIVIDQQGLERVRKMTRENPAAILWTHKTHVDGFMLQHLFYENDFPSPHTLGGVNMAFAGLGFLARRAGAIFIRRSFQDDVLYKMVLRQYIGYLLEKRFPFSWAFEGTRSRVGKLMPPRYGLLKYVVEAAHTTDARNLHIIPAALNYDLIGDVRDYATEQAGATKQPESLRWFIRYLRGLKQPLGRIYVDFGEPVILEQAPDANDKLELSKIAFQVGVEANRVTPITLAALTTMVLLGAAPRALTEQELIKEISQFVSWARERSIRLTNDFESENVQELTAMGKTLVASGLISRYDQGPEVVYAIAPEQHGAANYYRNTTIHFFVTKAIGELALLQVAGLAGDAVDAFWLEADRLRDLFKFEFFYAPKEEFHQELKAEFDRYQVGWEDELAANSNYGRDLLLLMTPIVAHTTLLSFVEAYRVVADVLARLDASVGLEQKDCISQSLIYGKQAYLQRRISSEASIGKLLFENGYKLLTNMGLTEAGGPDVGERRKRAAQDFRELARQLERVRAAALPG
ncbi:MAG: glycerol-3-phosphate O-acyltransferase [Halieaceae bacterium]|jgi:glycerol-3-phosphate O-acyltransferase